MTAAAIAGLLALALSGCTTPEPAAPTPTPAFASDEEAFAAAEETYRAYVDAVNGRRADPAADNPQDFLIGSALSADFATQRLLDDAGVRVVGSNTLTSFEGVAATNNMSEVTAAVCIDAAFSQVIDEQGEDVTPPNRDTTVALDVTLISIEGSFVISESTVSEVSSC